MQTPYNSCRDMPWHVPTIFRFSYITTQRLTSSRVAIANTLIINASSLRSRRVATILWYKLTVLQHPTYIILSIYPDFKTLIFENNTKIVLTCIKIIRIFVT